MASPNPAAGREPGLRRWEAAGPWLWVAAAVSGACLMVSLAFAVEPAANRTASLEALGWRGAMAAAAGLGVGVAVYGLCLNDLLDRRRDRALRKASGLIASGRLTRRAGLGVCVGALLLVVCCADVLGPASLQLAVLLAGGVLVYNLTLRFVPGVGVVSLGLLMALLMMVPNPRAGFLWPVLLSMTQVVAVGVWRAWGLGLLVKGWALWVVVLGWAFWVLWMVVLIRERSGDELFGASGVSGGLWVPAVVVGLGLGVAWRFGRTPRARAAVGLGAVGWLPVVDTAWLVSWGLWLPAALHAGLLVLTGFTAWAWSRRVDGRAAFIDELTPR
ncbi:MAG: hypothetical protein AAF710_01955 [Planctomycetota bacterium]